ncbi:MAG TPA: hypothetical protein VFS21_03270 [Roseiflexaceae bacterium]|nr:hypothetical protein [Roseiflexaceae bacterium]
MNTTHNVGLESRAPVARRNFRLVFEGISETDAFVFETFHTAANTITTEAKELVSAGGYSSVGVYRPARYNLTLRYSIDPGNPSGAEALANLGRLVRPENCTEIEGEENAA